MTVCLSQLLLIITAMCQTILLSTAPIAWDWGLGYLLDFMHSLLSFYRMATQVDQALSSLKKGEDYIQAGLVALPEYASELADVDADGNPLIIDEYRALMKRYVTMDNEYKAYITSVNDIKCLVS